MSSSNEPTEDEEICFNGYVLDKYCIERGTLLDNYLTPSLEEPFSHSVHCLVDVPRCVESGFELLLDLDDADLVAAGPTTTPDSTYCRAFRVDERGHELLLDMARTTGEEGLCTTCTGTPGGGITHGFRATVYGTVADPTTSPRLLHVTRVTLESQCPADTLTPSDLVVNCESGSYLPYIAAHGSLMLLSWGFFLPLGVLSARLLKQPRHPDHALWFHVHRIVQPTGLLLALAGWVTALAGPFDILGTGVYDVQFFHAVVGTSVMVLGVCQPINAYFRPHKGADGAPPSSARKSWECLHKGLGYVAVVMGLVNCLIGMALSGLYSDYFFWAILAGWAGLACYGCLFWVRQRRQRRQHQEEQEALKSPEEPEEPEAEVEEE